MSDSDEDDNFELYGTPLDPLDEDTISKKKPFNIEDQIATDDQGRRRFHGAFTGGFSAGFFNTVGSVEGWKPSEFRSSRSEKADKKRQMPEDFMDQEDLGEFGIAHKKLKATSDYSQSSKRSVRRNFEGPIPGEPILFSLLEPARETVGVKLLKKMGWKPGQGVGPRISKKEKRKHQKDRLIKIYGCDIPQNIRAQNSESENSDSDTELNFAPDDYDPFICKPKNDNFGLGYFGLAPKAQKVINFESQFRVTDRSNKKFSISGQAFGVGAFETEDDDIYSRDDLSKYDFELGPKKALKKLPEAPKFYHSTILEGFIFQSSKKYLKKTYPPPEVPKSFKPKHGARISRFEPLPESHKLFNFDKKKGRHDLTHIERSKILNIEHINIIAQKLAQNDSNVTQSSLDKKIQNLLNECKTNQSSKGSLKCSSVEQGFNLSSGASGSYLNTTHSSLSSKDQKDSKGKRFETAEYLEQGSKGQTLGSKGENLSSKSQDLSSKDGRFEIANQSLELRSRGQTLSAKGSKGQDWKNKLFTKSFERGEVLGDAISDTQKAANLSKKDPEDEERNKLQEQALKITEGLPKVDSIGFKPFLSDKEKQTRYETFLTLSKNGLKDQLAKIQPASMSDFEKEREIYEFEQASRLFKPTLGLVFDKFVSSSNQGDDLDPLKSVTRSVFDHGTLEMREAAKKKMYGPLTRVVFQWTPHKLLCRRFNVPEPQSSEEMSVPAKKRNRFNIFDYYEAYQQNRSKEDQIPIEEKRRNIEKNEDKKEENEVKETPQIQLEKRGAIEENEEKQKESEEKESPQIPIGKPSTSTEIIQNIPEIEEKTIPNEERSSVVEDIEEKIDIPTDPKAKKDLFKAIFLSSDSEEESEEEKEEDKLEEMKKIVEESLTKKTEEKSSIQIEKIEEKNEATMKKGEEKEENRRKGFFADLDLTKFKKSSDSNLKKIDEDSSKMDEDISSFYGPAIPKKGPSSKNEEWKPIFTKPKNIKVENLNQTSSNKIEDRKVDKVLKIIEEESSTNSDEWVEADKSSKKKKDSKKNKKHKKHKVKHRKHKKKKKTDSD